MEMSLKRRRRSQQSRRKQQNHDQTFVSIPACGIATRANVARDHSVQDAWTLTLWPAARAAMEDFWSIIFNRMCVKENVGAVPSGPISTVSGWRLRCQIEDQEQADGACVGLPAVHAMQHTACIIFFYLWVFFCYLLDPKFGGSTTSRVCSQSTRMRHIAFEALCCTPSVLCNEYSICCIVPLQLPTAP